MKPKIIHNNKATKYAITSQIKSASKKLKHIFTNHNKQGERLCRKHGCNKCEPKQHYTANSNYHASIHHFKKQFIAQKDTKTTH